MPETIIERRMRFEKSAHGAAVSGFDHFHASMACWVGLLVIGCGFAGAIFTVPWTRLVAPCTAAGAAVFVLVQLLRFRLAVARGGLTLERSWAGVVYSRLTCTRLDDVEFIISGTGDQGDDGPWPSQRYCEIGAPGFSDAFIGSPGAAERLCNFLADESARVLRTAA